MPESRLNELIERMEVIAKLGGWLKGMIVAVFFVACWLTTLQLQVAGNKDSINEIRLDRKERIASAQAWRSQKDKEDSTRDATLTQVAKIQEHQQGLIEKLISK